MSTKLVGTPRSLTEQARIEKNARIAASQKATREKRKNQTCKVFELKFLTNKLSRRQKHALKMAFVEAKWLYNAIIASEDPFAYEIGHEVEVKTKDGELELRPFEHLGSQMKQDVKKQILQSIKSLATRKKHGGKVGRLRFVSQVNSLNLIQFGTTYKINGTRVKIQNIPGRLRVRGASQLEGYELANARLVQKPSGYYLKVTAFIDNDKLQDFYTPHTVVGVDMGVKTHLTLSNGEKINAEVGQTDRLKRLQRKLARQQKGSNGYQRTRQKIGKENEKLSRKRDDLANQIVHRLLINELVVIQDENISTWKRKRGFIKGGRKIQWSILGRVKSKLAKHPRCFVVPRFEPTTQMCVCGAKTLHGVDQRVFKCSKCGYERDRDVHAAENMIRFAMYLWDAGNLSWWSHCKTLEPAANSWWVQEHVALKPEAARS